MEDPYPQIAFSLDRSGHSHIGPGFAYPEKVESISFMSRTKAEWSPAAWSGVSGGHSLVFTRPATFNQDSADPDLLESTLARLSQMVGRRLREHNLHARTIQIKLRYSDFTTFTRAHTLDHATQIDLDLIEHSRLLFRKNWTGAKVRLLGVQASQLDHQEGQLDLLEGDKSRKWRTRTYRSRQTKRPLRREVGLRSHRPQGPVRRARPRKPGQPARQEA